MVVWSIFRLRFSSVWGIGMKYAIYGALLAAVVCGAYYSGYSIGKRDVRIEYITKEKEVVKYVEAEKNKIYSVPVDTPDNLIRLFNDGVL